jgi:hypothetical protein
VDPVVRKKFLGALAQHGLRQRIGEDHRLVIDDQVRGPRRRRGQRGQARLSISNHTRQITINYLNNNTK